MLHVLLAVVLLAACGATHAKSLQQPFLIKISSTTHVIGNGIWNVTIVGGFGRKLYYKGAELVGRSTGHYSSLSTWSASQSMNELIDIPRWRDKRFGLESCTTENISTDTHPH
jgi:hypothetical protein